AADFRRVLAAVLRLNGCRTVAGLSHDGVPVLLELIPADVLSVELLRLNGEPIHSITSPGWPYTRAQIAFYRAHVAAHPILAHYARHGIGRALRVSDVVAHAEYERNPIYARCMKPHGLRHTLAMIFDAAPGRHTAISFDRRAHDFTVREVALLEAVAPHLAALLVRLELHTGKKRPWREPTTRDWLAGDLGVSNREAELLLHLAEGLGNREIAAKAGLAEATVRKHFENAFRKLGVANRVAAAKLARERVG
ncbi:MAG: response regulator transcription factor, partial [Opitutaceae bacterium]|nr:response regulator transcription factor [Opitutaceae bacterium]